MSMPIEIEKPKDYQFPKTQQNKTNLKNTIMMEKKPLKRISLSILDRQSNTRIVSFWVKKLFLIWLQSFLPVKI